MRKYKYKAGYDSYPLCVDMQNLMEITRKAAQEMTGIVPNKNIVLVGTGTSGAMMITGLGIELGRLKRKPHSILLRKDDEGSHRGGHAIFDARLDEDPAVFIVDDQVSSGDTLRNILTALPKIKYNRGDREVHLPTVVHGLVLARSSWEERIKEAFNESQYTLQSLLFRTTES